MQYPSNLKRTATARYDTYYPANSKDRPKLVFNGPDVGEMSFTMIFDQRFNSNIRDILSEFVIWVNEGWAGELVIGTKAYGHNKWVCTKAVITFVEVLVNGVIWQAKVDVTLKEI